MHFGRFFGSVAVAIALIFITSFLSTQQNIFFSTKPLDLRKLSPINVSQDRRSYSWKAEPNIAATATQHNSTKRDSLRSVTALRSEHKPSSPDDPLDIREWVAYHQSIGVGAYTCTMMAAYHHL